MAPPLFSIPVETAGKLSLMACPPVQALDQSITHLADQGVDVVVSLLTDEDVLTLGVAEEETLCQTAGITFVRHPIVDFGVPAGAGFNALITDIAQHLRAGHHIVVHCRAGIGRSGLVAICVLATLGIPVAQAIAHVSDARGVPVPETAPQKSFVLNYAAAL